MDELNIFDKLFRNKAAGHIIREISPYVHQNSNVLDIGSGFGITAKKIADELKLKNRELRAAREMLAKENVTLKQDLRQKFSPGSILGVSRQIKDLLNKMERIADTPVSILITGETGTGKELIAKTMHYNSGCAGKLFAAINCSAIPDTLLEGELFGYKKGAFTDAHNDKIGLLQEAVNGTIFLDEIGDMPLSIQPKILRAIQEKEIRPLGSIQTAKIDVRIIAASNQNLTELIAEKRFREDLYYRLNAMQVELPSLRERREDIGLLVTHFLNRFQSKHGQIAKGITDMALKKLNEYSWPGNVRELENVIERAALLAQGEWITPDDLLFQPQEEGASLPLADWAKSKKPLGAIEREYIVEVLNSVGGNRSQTAKILGIGRKTLYNKLARIKA